MGVGARRARAPARRQPRRGHLHRPASVSSPAGRRSTPVSSSRSTSSPTSRPRWPSRFNLRSPATSTFAREGPDTSLGSALARDVAVRAVATAGAAGAAWTVARFTGTPTRARTVALAALVGAQLGQTLVIGHRSPLVLGSGIVSVGALVGIVQTPGVSQFFGCRPLGPIGWTIATSAACTATVGAAAASLVLARTEPSTQAPQSTIDIRDRDTRRTSSRHPPSQGPDEPRPPKFTLRPPRKLSNECSIGRYSY